MNEAFRFTKAKISILILWTLFYFVVIRPFYFACEVRSPILKELGCAITRSYFEWILTLVVLYLVIVLISFIYNKFKKN
ncbi:MAG TPA: hypothetical protein VJI68_01805 [Candidatus Nanoarchaeia archaeon]|nr:hypothetical protein [Candidatus Nanoarchaeia archaeon]